MAKPKAVAEGKNSLYYGDNLPVLQHHIGTDSVDLVYLDPPFNSNRSYNVIFNRHDVATDPAAAQIQAFDDTWHWTPVTEEQYAAYVGGGLPNRAADALRAFRTLLGENDAMAYLVNMAPRLVELRRVLKPTGSLYLHCDPTMSHYLKVLLDAIFGAENFRNEITWQRVAAKGGQMTRLPANHDTILSYTRTAGAPWNEIRQPYDPEALDEKTLAKYTHHDADGRRYRLGPLLHPEQGRRPNLEYELMGVTKTWRWSKDRMAAAVEAGRIIQTKPGSVPQQKMYLDEQPGRLVGDVWTDISVLNSQAAERLGYPTQKPTALLKRILQASTEEGDVVLDPFCGCGTTIDAAQQLGRRWIGIDITYIAVDLIAKRLRHRFTPAIEQAYEILGIPRDLAGAQALADRSKFDFERWAVSLINAQPNEKQVGDKGIDGEARFPLGAVGQKDGGIGRILVSVKGGKALNPAMARDLQGTVEGRKAQMGVLITMAKPTAGVLEAVNTGGTFVHPANAQTYPKLQVITVAELLDGKRPKMPTTMLPYISAVKIEADEGTTPLW